MYAKVARSDYPREWPGLFHDLLANLDTAGKRGGPGGGYRLGVLLQATRGARFYTLYSVLA